MLAVAITGSIGGQSHSTITIADWHLYGTPCGVQMAAESASAMYALFSVVSEVAGVAATGDGAVRRIQLNAFPRN